jgi:hypothetical protein
MASKTMTTRYGSAGTRERTKERSETAFSRAISSPGPDLRAVVEALVGPDAGAGANLYPHLT